MWVAAAALIRGSQGGQAAGQGRGQRAGAVERQRLHLGSCALYVAHKSSPQRPGGLEPIKDGWNCTWELLPAGGTAMISGEVLRGERTGRISLALHCSGRREVQCTEMVHGLAWPRRCRTRV